MDAVSLLAELRERGAHVELLPENRFAVVPASAIDAPLRDSLRAHKEGILQLLRGADSITSAPILETRDDQAAVRIHSDLFDGEVWLARDKRVAAELAAEVAQAGSEIPILTFDEVARLQGKSDAMKRALLTTLSAMPGSRLVQ